jgi:hypothetical protein
MDADQPVSQGLGSLAQTARSKQLKQARGILIAIGVLTILVNGFQLAFARSMAEEAVQEEVKKQGVANPDPASVKALEDQMVTAVYVVGSAVILVGVVFVVFGLILHKFPVPIAVTSLVIYLACAAIFGLLDPTSLARGWILKIIVIVGLVRTVQAAVAYSREKAALAPVVEVDE